jgi:hypothetical protein
VSINLNDGVRLLLTKQVRIILAPIVFKRLNNGFWYGTGSEQSRSTTWNRWWAILDSNQEPMD